LSDTGNLSVVGLQWGDEGKGKIVDYLAGDYDAVARFNGGSNAGHTVVIDGSKHTFHLIPSGALKGKELLVGAGVAVDPVILADELSLLPSGARDRLTVDGGCSLVSPVDKEFDAKLEESRGASAIGTTKRGIGPAYAMRALRLGPRVMDLIAGFDFTALSAFYEKMSLDSAGLAAWAEDAAMLLEGITGDVGGRVTDISESGGSVLFETSQGTLLDVLHGTYPFVTATHTVSSYIPAALGISPKLSGDPLGVMKCYATRVGAGPFPTELGGPKGEELRSLGGEYGATTGRPRRVGWLDLVSLKYAIGINGVKEVAISKLDVLSRFKELKVCSAYKIAGNMITDFQQAAGRLDKVEPVLDTPDPLYGADFGGGMPLQARKFVSYVEEALDVTVRLISYGEERSRTIEL
jgi:adenylosuccinate synthase